jgi:transcriptional regulator with XRE-family HTH domain
MAGDWLSRKLTALRQDAGLTQGEAAAALGLAGGAGQVRMSRIESGTFVPTEAEVRALAGAYRAAPAVTEVCLLWAERDTASSAISARKILTASAAHQKRVGKLAEASAEVLTWQPLIIPGLLQTPGYVRAVFADRHTGKALDDAVKARTAHAGILHTGRTFGFVIAEGALRWSAGPQVMAGQLEHLAELAGEHRIGVIPQAQTVSTFPVHGFDLYDRGQVLIGLRHAAVLVGDADGVAAYVAWWEQLEGLAVFADDARDVIERVAREYRAGGTG